MLHGKMHLMQIQASMVQPMDNVSPDGAKGKPDNKAPITENNSAPTIQ